MYRIGKNKKWLVSLLASFAMLAAACGSDAPDDAAPSATTEVEEEPASTDSEPDTTTADSEPESEPEPEVEPVTITFWDNQQTESGLSDFQQIAVDEFEALNPGITVEVVTVPYGDYQQRLQLAVQGGEAPDVSTVDQIWTAGFAQSGSIVPLSGRVAGSDSINQEAFFPGAWDSAAFDDEVWAIPFNVDVWQFSFYNQTMFDEAGIDPASITTWSGLEDAAAALTGDGQFGVGLIGHVGEDTVVVMDSFIYSNGGSILHEDGTCALTDPEAVEALEYLEGLQEYAPSGILNNGVGEMRELFLNGSLGVEWWPSLEQPTLQNSDIDWGFVAGTAPEGKTPVGTYGGWNLVVYWDSLNQDAAWKFIEFMTDPDVIGRVVDLLPAHIDAASEFVSENRSDPDVVLEHLNNARPRPLSAEYLQVADIQIEMWQLILNGTSVGDATAAACGEIDDL